MKKSRFTESQISTILKLQEVGQSVADICREYGISNATFYQWKSKYGGMNSSQLKRLKELAHENSRLKKMFADLSLAHQSRLRSPLRLVACPNFHNTKHNRWWKHQLPNRFPRQHLHHQNHPLERHPQLDKG